MQNFLTILRKSSSKYFAVARVFFVEALSTILKNYRWGLNTSEIRILFVAYAPTPTLQLSFLKPLETIFAAKKLAAELLSEQQILFRFLGHDRQRSIQLWIERRILKLQPDIIIFCRYSGRYTKFIMEHAKLLGIPTVFHIDDDLLNVPLEIGRQKFEYHNHPMRLANVRYLLRHSDLVYCSTPTLKRQLAEHGNPAKFIAGDIYCASKILRRPAFRRPKTIGYMGFDHDHDLCIAVPAIIAVMRKHPYLKFEIFGTIKRPVAFDEFGERVRVIPPVRKYNKFMQVLADRDWDIGICPLAKTNFNALKANTKWVEYTAAGIAVIGSSETIYESCCSDGCGILADPDNWETALEKLVVDDEARYRIVAKAQAKLEESYSVDALTRQVLGIFRLARETPLNRLMD